MAFDWRAAIAAHGDPRGRLGSPFAGLPSGAGMRPGMPDPNALMAQRNMMLAGRQLPSQASPRAMAPRPIPQIPQTRPAMTPSLPPAGQWAGRLQPGTPLRPGGPVPTFPALAAQRAAAEQGAREAQLRSMLQAAGYGGFTTSMPPGSSSGGNPSNAATAAGGMTATAGQTAGPNTGGVAPAGMSAAEAVAAGFGALSGEGLSPGFNASAGNPASSLGGQVGIGGLGLSAAQSAAAGMQTGFGPNVGFGPDSPVGNLGPGENISIGQTADGQTVSVNSSTGVVSVGGEAVGIAGGGGGAVGGGDSGGFGGIGMGGVADGSSNAGIGGPGGTGAVGGAGDAGQGTGGPGEGDRYGGHFTVGGAPAPPDSMNVRLRATPGEHVLVVPPDKTPGQILQMPEQPTQWQKFGNPFMGLRR